MSLTFAIAAHRRPDLRQRLLNSLKATVLPHEILIAEPKFGEGVGALRNRLYLQARGTHVYFLDEDCEWIGNADRLARYLESGDAYTGPYRDGTLCGFFGRAYNRMTNAWLRWHADAGQVVPVGGNLLLPKLCGFTPYCEQARFGGEEISVRDNLRGKGLTLHFRDNLAVAHNAQHSLISFLARAWRHGRAPNAEQPRHGRARWGSFPSRHPLLLAAVFGYALTQSLARWSGRKW